MSLNSRRITCASDLSGWKKSSYSGGNDNCVEVTEVPTHQAVAVRDSKNPAGPALVVSPAAFAEFVREAAAGDVR